MRKSAPKLWKNTRRNAPKTTSILSTISIQVKNYNWKIVSFKYHFNIKTIFLDIALDGDEDEQIEEQEDQDQDDESEDRSKGRKVKEYF